METWFVEGCTAVSLQSRSSSSMRRYADDSYIFRVHVETSEVNDSRIGSAKYTENVRWSM